MIGLVFTSVAGAAGAVARKFRASPPGPRAEFKPRTLEEECATRGIEMFSVVKVRAYQRDYLRREKIYSFAGDDAAWLKETPEAYGKQYPFGTIPEDAQRTIEKARTIPGAAVHIEWFYADPFVLVSRPRGNWATETCCIAYWDAPGFTP